MSDLLTQENLHTTTTTTPSWETMDSFSDDDGYLDFMENEYQTYKELNHTNDYAHFVRDIKASDAADRARKSREDEENVERTEFRTPSKRRTRVHSTDAPLQPIRKRQRRKLDNGGAHEDLETRFVNPTLEEFLIAHEQGMAGDTRDILDIIEYNRRQ